MRIIPAIDVIDGKCVRLTQGDYAQKTVYNNDPAEVAKEFERAGMKYLHLVDLDGAKAGKVQNWNVIRDITSKTKMTVDFGGGIKTDEEITKLLELGVSQINLGSVAVKNPEKVMGWVETFGAEKIILSADVKGNMIAIHGWQEKSTLHIRDFIRQFQQHGIVNITCTDISTDGTLKGPNSELYEELLSEFPGIQLVASGGVGNIGHLRTLKKTGVNGVIVGKAIYEGKITMQELLTV